MAKNRPSTEMDFGVRVAAVIGRGGLLLLVRHQKPGRDPYWVLPGGRLEPGETIPECAAREVREETGLGAAFSGVLYVGEFLREGRHTVDVTVRMTTEDDAEASLGADPEVAPDAEPTLSELRWVDAEEVREIQLLPAPLRERLLEDAPGGWAADEVYLGGGNR
jgi:ADP-ribose pyrophosphatase YjhB (NUDIX family)